MHLLSRLERLLQMDTVSLDIRKSAPNHVSVAEEKLFPIMVERTRTTPFVEYKWYDGEFFVYEFFPGGGIILYMIFKMCRRCKMHYC